MSSTSKLSLYICKTKCWQCGKEYNAAYGKRIIGEQQFIFSPESFSDAHKKLVEENGVIIKTFGYGDSNAPYIHTVNVCPHCGAKFGKSHIKELVGNELKEIMLIPKQE